jgi:NAD(P)-dependent dehydrogenase (short-subunit alcohol dehydrogenase family)
MSMMLIGRNDDAAINRRVSLVTGGTGGIGRAVAIKLATGGDRVLFIGRDQDRAAEVLAALHLAQPGASHCFIRADLSLLGETARAAEEVARRTPRLDAAVFCAGILSTIPEWTAEGFERNFALNYLSRYLMARCLLSRLTMAPSGRLVLVSNAGKYRDTLDFSDLQHRQGTRGLAVAGRTQFANDLLAIELAERLRGTRVDATCVFPGIVKTDVFVNACGIPRPVKLLASVAQTLIGMTPDEAAQTPVFLAQAPAAAGAGGRFYGPRRKERRVPDAARRPERRRALWDLSEQLVQAYLLNESPETAPVNFERLQNGAHSERCNA